MAVLIVANLLLTGTKCCELCFYLKNTGSFIQMQLCHVLHRKELRITLLKTKFILEGCKIVPIDSKGI